ncbi:MAG: hypothetical protein ACRDZ8_05860 [Acidimicrobiales bacterium]
MQPDTVAPDAENAELEPTAGLSCSLAPVAARGTTAVGGYSAPSCGCLPPLPAASQPA